LYAGITALGFLACGLLWLAYPFGIPSPDTGSHIQHARSLHLLSPNWYDWSRTPVFSLLMKIAGAFPDPNTLIYWTHMIIFVLSFNIAAWSLLPLVFKPRHAFALSALLLCMEVLIMNAFFANAHMLSDALYTSSVFIGCLLMLGGWKRKKMAGLYGGALILGLAPLIKPVGLILLPLWLLFLLLACPVQRRFRSAALCCALLLGPTLFWSARNAYVYQRFSLSGYGSFHLLASVIPFLQDGDTIFDDPEKNLAFIEGVRRFQTSVGTTFSDYMGNQTRSEPAPYVLIMTLEPTLTPPEHREGQQFLADSARMRVALRIIAQHPVAYLRQTWERYYRLMTPLNTGFPFVSSDAAKVYEDTLSRHSEPHLRFLYPPEGSVDTSRPNKKAGALLAALQTAQHPRIQSFLKNVESLLFPVWHLLPLVLLLSWGVPTLRRWRPAAVYLSMLFLTAALQCAGTAAVVVVTHRYSLPAQLFLDLTTLLLITLPLPFVLSALRKRLSLRQ